MDLRGFFSSDILLHFPSKINHWHPWKKGKHISSSIFTILRGCTLYRHADILFFLPTDRVLASLRCVCWIRSSYRNNKVRTSFVLCIGFYASDTAVSASINAVVVIMNNGVLKPVFCGNVPIIFRQLYLISNITLVCCLNHADIYKEGMWTLSSLIVETWP